MKYIFSISCLLVIMFIHTVASAFVPNPNKRPNGVFKNSISLNFSEPILRVLTKNYAVDSSYNLKSPILYYARHRTKMTYRIGARVTMKNGLSKSDLYLDKNSTIYNRYEASLSALRIKSVSDRFQVGYGLGIAGFGLWDKKIFDSGFDKVTFDTHVYSAAAGPQMLLKYSLNSRLSLFTEYFLAYQVTSSYSGKKFSAFPEQNYTNDRTLQRGFQFDYPISFYMTYQF